MKRMGLASQLCFPGMERPSSWNPRPHTLEHLKSYLAGFQAHGRAIYAKRKYIAAKLGLGVRTLSRYLAHLSEIGWIQTVRRTARTTIRKVLQCNDIPPNKSDAVGRRRDTVSVGASCEVPEYQPSQRAFPSEHAHQIRQQSRPIIGVNGGTVGRLAAPPKFIAGTSAGTSKEVTPESLRSQRREVLSTEERVERHHQDDAALCEVVRKSAGFERLSESDRRYVGELGRAGLNAETVAAGVFLGRARRLVSQSNGKTPGAIRSVRYFASTITEAAAGLPAGYADYLRGFVERRAIVRGA